MANDAVKKPAGEMQRALEAVHRTHSAKPIDEVRNALHDACRGPHMTPNTDQLDVCARAIAEGTRIVLNVQPVRL